MFPLKSTSLHFTSLHSTSIHFTSLHSTSIHFTSIHFTSLHFTSLHSTSIHFTSLHSTSIHFTSLHSTSIHFRGFSNPVDYQLKPYLLPVCLSFLLHRAVQWIEKCPTIFHATSLHFTSLHFTSLQGLQQPCGLSTKTVPSACLSVISSVWNKAMNW